MGTLIAAGVLSTGTASRLGVTAPLPETQAIAQALEGARRAEVTLSTGVSAVTVRGDAGADLLAEGTVRPQRGERIEQSFSLEGGVARFDVSSEGRARGWFLPPTAPAAGTST